MTVTPHNSIVRQHGFNNRPGQKHVTCQNHPLPFRQCELQHVNYVISRFDRGMFHAFLQMADNGIVGWHALYLSSEVGLRKDTGDLYHHILATEQVTPQQILMIGDNEHSDVQIPSDMGIKIWHVMRPVELAQPAATTAKPAAKPRRAPLDLSSFMTQRSGT